MRYSLHDIDRHDVVATTVAADRDEALEWFSEKLRLMLTFEGELHAAQYLLDELGGDRNLSILVVAGNQSAALR